MVLWLVLGANYTRLPRALPSPGTQLAWSVVQWSSISPSAFATCNVIGFREDPIRRGHHHRLQYLINLFWMCKISASGQEHHLVR